MPDQENQFVVVSRPWGVADGPDRSDKDADTIGWWFRVLLQALLKTTNPDIIYPEVIYTQTTQECVIIQLNLATDIRKILGAHPRPPSQVMMPYKTHSIVYEYNFKKYGDPEKGQWTARYPTDKPIPPRFPLSHNTPYPSPQPYDSSILGDEATQRPRWALPLPPNLIQSAPPPAPPPLVPIPAANNPEIPSVSDPRLRTGDPRSLASGGLGVKEETKPFGIGVKYEASPELIAAVAQFLQRHQTTASTVKSDPAVSHEALAAAIAEYESRNSEGKGVKHEKQESDVPIEQLSRAVAEFQARQSGAASHGNGLKQDPELTLSPEELARTIAEFQAQQASRAATVKPDPDSSLPVEALAGAIAIYYAGKSNGDYSNDTVKPDPEQTVPQELLAQAIASYQARPAQSTTVKPDPDYVSPEVLGQAIAEYQHRRRVKSEPEGDVSPELLAEAIALFQSRPPPVKLEDSVKSEESSVPHDILAGAVAQYQANQGGPPVTGKRVKHEENEERDGADSSSDRLKRMKREF
ncbi:hypothetical protein HGRIS_009984 [Hohenbuehelia grisea]|uniref:Uncharacterized protein n=1 Tax=Hohenbuehelia grisea TaxID=104357 RepID=A0ABR3J2X9_9AGAR